MNISTTLVPTTALLSLNNTYDVTYDQARSMMNAMKKGRITYKGCVVASDMTYDINTKPVQDTLKDEVMALIKQAAKEARQVNI